MKCDLEWLAEWMPDMPPPEELAPMLTAAGLEVAGHEGQILDLELTPNRGDCLSMLGLAREVAALTGTPPGVAPVPESGLKPKKTWTELGLGDVDADACPYYSLCLLEELDAQAPTPDWMRRRLERGGIRTHHLLVDITNYVMLELGQPLHAFDADAVAADVSVRRARANESIRALDEAALLLEPDMLVIAVGSHPIAVAGIIGGAGSAVGEGTSRVLLEAAHFAPASIAGRARRLKLHTESSHRFERGVDPALAPRAMRRAVELMLEHAGGHVAGFAAQGRPAPAHRPQTIRLRAERLAKRLALEVDAAEVERMLVALGCAVRAQPGQWEVRAPSWRFDLGIEEDLIEEVARVHGYDRIPAAAPPAPCGWDVPEQLLERQFRHCRTRLTECGYSEAVTYSFVEERLERMFAPEAEPSRLLNPISQELAVMRSTLGPSLLRAAQYNFNRQQSSVRLFELARVFASEGEAVRETWALGGVACGLAYPLQWGAQAQEIDFYDVKGDLESLLQDWLDDVAFEPAEHAALHPGQTARLMLQGRDLGMLGALHPRLCAEFDLPGPAFVFELELEAWAGFPTPSFAPCSDYPAVARDLSVVVPEHVTAEAVQACVRALDMEELRTCTVFDVYRGTELETPYKSFGLHLIFQSFSRTLTDSEVDRFVASAAVELERRTGARMR